MSEQIPAGWYPDPKDTESDPRPERWWDGKGWTATTRPVPAAGGAASAADGARAEDGTPAGPGGEPTVLEGRVVDDGPTVRYPEFPLAAEPAEPAGPAKPRRRPSRVVVTAVVAALAGGAVGAGITYLAMDHRDERPVRAGVPGHRFGGGSDDGFGRDGQGMPNPPGRRGQGAPAPDGVAVDAVNRISVKIPGGWEGGTTREGFAALTIGSYPCADGQGECSLGGAVTGRINGTDAKQAALADIATAAKESYGDIASHEELKSEAVKVAGRDGYLVRWKVDAPKGNDGYVETVVFPTAGGKQLVSVHLGFDIDPKAPDQAQMDAVVGGIADYRGAAEDPTRT
ncbi:DUF2510 domain-containing protein [Kitasatospora camelliae]|uniref:DUF2510 domain-containing protein n=1 Tax=Kitasatospora camelliae TaxID=3156397 RepID=A0AAU8K1G2_9ACTN